MHGTTVATNTVLEGAGVRAGLLITRGFRAVYEARGWVRPEPGELLDPFFRKPPLLIPQSRTEEISERLDYQGNVIDPLDEACVREAAQRLKAKGVETVAVCYLFSFRNPAHEERTAEVLAEEEPAWRISLSSRILPVIREYPRLSTTVVDAYVGPIMERYLVELDRQLKQHGIATSGFSDAVERRADAHHHGRAFSQPDIDLGAGGRVVAGVALAEATGDATSSPRHRRHQHGYQRHRRWAISETANGRIAGQDIGTPMLAVHTPGAGGGTIAWIGRDGLMKVGLHSAGAVPGPACYGRGGTSPRP